MNKASVYWGFVNTFLNVEDMLELCFKEFVEDIEKESMQRVNHLRKLLRRKQRKSKKNGGYYA